MARSQLAGEAESKESILSEPKLQEIDQDIQVQRIVEFCCPKEVLSLFQEQATKVWRKSLNKLPKYVPLQDQFGMSICQEDIPDVVGHQGNMALAQIEIRNTVGYRSSLVPAHLYWNIRVFLPLPEVDRRLEIR